MLLKLSKLTGDDSERAYINTHMIAAVGPVTGDPDRTLVIMIDRSKTLVEKPVEEVVRTLKEHDASLML